MVVKSKVKYIQSLSQKKQRDEDDVFIAEGPKIINELLNESTISLQELFALKEWTPSNVSNQVPITTIDDITLSRISSLSTPNQVLGIFRKPTKAAFVARGNLSLLLQTIQDPGNMGSIIRCADWFGIRQVVCSKDCVDVFSPKTVQSTMGSIARVNVFYEDLTSIIKDNHGVPVYATTLGGRSIFDLQKITEGMLIIGNESKGISPDLLQLAVEHITIPRKGNAESLNAAVATGIVLSHMVK